MPVQVHYITVARKPLKVSDLLISYQSRFFSRLDSNLIIPVLILQRCRIGDQPWPEESLITVSASLEPDFKAQGPPKFVLQVDSFVDAARCHPDAYRSIGITEGFPSFTVLGQINSVTDNNCDMTYLQVLPWTEGRHVWVTITDRRIQMLSTRLVGCQVQVTGTLGVPHQDRELCVKAHSAIYLDRGSWLHLSSGTA